jgi:hypothetical protein
MKDRFRADQLASQLAEMGAFLPLEIKQCATALRRLC